MANFTLDSSTLGVLGGSQFKTVPFEMGGPCREVKFTWTQAGTGQDMEPHYCEIHLTLSGPSKEDL